MVIPDHLRQSSARFDVVTSEKFDPDHGGGRPLRIQFDHWQTVLDAQGSPMAEDYVATVRIRRPAKVTTDDRGRTVWSETIETAQLELVSTAQLKTILQSDDDESRSSIERLLQGKDDGVLARDPATGLFEVISDADLQTILASDDKLPPTRRPADVTLEPIDNDAGDALSLVSTQMLRKIIKTDDKASAGNVHKKSIGATPATGKTAIKKDKSGGFDPYNSG